MRPDQLRRLATILAVLLVVWGGLSLLRRARADRPEGFDLPHFNRAEVDTILVTRGDTTVRLVRKGAGWMVNQYTAVTASVKEFLDALADTAATSELVARSASSHERLGVDSVKGKRVAAKAGAKALVTYVVGNRGPNWESAYVRRPGANDVYLLKGRLAELAERKVDDWRDKHLASVEPDSVGEIEVTRGKTNYLLKRDGKAWKFKDGAETDSAAVASLLGQFKSLDAAGFATPAQADSADFVKPERRVRLARAGGRPLLQLTIDSAGYNYWVRKDTLSTVYRMDSWAVDQLTPKDSTLRKKMPGKVEAPKPSAAAKKPAAKAGAAAKPGGPAVKPKAAKKDTTAKHPPT